MEKYVCIAIGGSLGSITRYWVETYVACRVGIKFPYGTFLINISACMIIGFALTFLSKRADVSPVWSFLIPTGFVGAYSTFSTFEWETFSSLRSCGCALAVGYVVASVICGLIAVWAGSSLGASL